ncbi:MAG: glutamate synthase-related protein [bacterium]
MPGKFIIHPQHAPPRFEPIGKFQITRDPGCINCGKCIAVCIYDVHSRSEEDYREMADPVDYRCKNCFNCIQECPKGVLSMSINPQYQELGDALYAPEIITSIMSQAERGEIPVLGGGYGGPFSGPGFDAMWTDMSEIVRPTRDGIHGREYISTAVDLGRKPQDVTDLRFDESGNPITNIPPTVEVKLPILFDRLPFSPAGDHILLSLAAAAAELGTFVVIERDRCSPALLPFSNHIVESLSPEDQSWRKIVDIAKSHSVLELIYSPELKSLPESLKGINPDLIVFVRLETFDDVEPTVTQLCQSGVDVVHIHVDPYNDMAPGCLPEIVQRVHTHLVGLGMRDSVTIIASGEIAAAEHVPKAIILGADAVAVDIPALIAMECTVCKECVAGKKCPRELESIDPRWGIQRIVNLMASWHNQLLEVLGAMGLREVSRLRGEMGRAMFKEKLDEEILANILTSGGKLCSR